MGLHDKLKSCLSIVEYLFSLSDEDVAKIEELIKERKTLTGKLFGATINKKSGNTEQLVRTQLKNNAQEIKNVLNGQQKTDSISISPKQIDTSDLGF